MGRLMVITSPDLAPGFQLAGVETFVAEGVETAERILRKLLTGDEASLIVVHRELLQGMGPRLRRQIELSYRPVVVDIPAGMPIAPGEERRRYVSELIRRAIGFHITFGNDRPESSDEQ
ncbi:MAG: V-type ATP synthase subunit F [Anaerolineae bacterium]|nr:V-type ATP synthase subunit F [Anaerolineae bacterium]